MVNKGIVTERDAHMYGKALTYLERNIHASKSKIHDYVGLTYDESKILIQNLLDRGLIEPVEGKTRNQLGLTGKGLTAATLYKKWMKSVGAE